MPSATKPKASLTFEAIGTQWNIELTADPTQAQALARDIADRISQFDHHYSRFRADSWVTHAGSHPGAHKPPADFAPMFRLYQEMYAATDGAVTPLIGEAMERAGYNAAYSLRPKALRAIPKLEDTLLFQDNTLHVKYKCVLDFGAAGKGYLVDLVAELLESKGVNHYIIDAGGDIRVASPAPAESAPVTTVALEDPRDPSKAIGQVRLDGRQQGSSLCGSAPNRRAWGDMHHIIDPHTLRPTTDIAATWVVTDSTMLADGLATCLFFTSPEKLLRTFSFDYVILHTNGTANVSANFPGELF